MDFKPKKFREGRFEFALYVNDNIICKRNFDIENYIERSMLSSEFRHTVGDVVDLIKDDLASKTRVYCWYHNDPEDPNNALNKPLIPEGECTFKFVVSDGRRVVATQIWDGSVYPKAIRDRVDIANKTVRVLERDGNVYTYDKDAYFEANKDRLSFDMYVTRAMLAGRKNLIDIIIKKIQDTCSPQDGTDETALDDAFIITSGEDKGKKMPHTSLKHYTLEDVFVGEDGKKTRYTHNLYQYNKNLAANWSKSVREKTQKLYHV